MEQTMCSPCRGLGAPQLKHLPRPTRGARACTPCSGDNTAATYLELDSPELHELAGPVSPDTRTCLP